MWTICSLHAISSGIPLKTEEVLKQNLSKTFGTDQYTYLRNLTVGDSGALLAVIEVGQKKLVFRSISSNRTVEQVASEILATELASFLNVGPKVYCADVKNKIVITDFIEADHGYSFQHPKQSTAELASFLKRLKSLNLNRKDRMYLTNLEKFKSWDLSVLPQDYQKMCKKILEGVLESYRYFENFTPMLSHSDLHFDNVVLAADKLYVIDWESFSISNLPFEMAAVIHRTVISEEEIPSLMQQVYGRYPTELEIAEFRIASIIYLFLQGVNDLNKLEPSQRFHLESDSLDSIPVPSIYLNKIFNNKEDITPQKKMIYGWGMMKRAYEMIKSKNFKKDLKLIKHHQKEKVKPSKNK